MSTAVKVRTEAVAGSAVLELGDSAAPPRWPAFVGGTAVVQPQLEGAFRLSYLGLDGSTSITSPLFETRPKTRASIWDRLAKLRLAIPADERASYPRDATRDLDGYLRHRERDARA